MTPAPRPFVRLVLNGSDISADVAPLLESFQYTDHQAGEADSHEVTLADPSGKWRTSWEPEEGDTLEAWVGYEGGALLHCGEFQINEIEHSGPPSKVSIRATAAAVRKALRTPQSRRWINASLRDVAARIASEHGLELLGEVPDIHFQTLSQARETDLGFLFKLADDLGVVFSVRGSRLIWHQVEKLEGQFPVAVLRPGVCEAYSLKKHVRPSSSEVQTFSPEEKRVMDAAIKATGARGGDVLRIGRRFQGASATRAMKAAHKKTKTGRQREGTVTLSQGDPRAVAGVVLDLDAAPEAFGNAGGKYLAWTSRHGVTRSGAYVTEVELRHV